MTDSQGESCSGLEWFDFETAKRAPKAVEF